MKKMNPGMMAIMAKKKEMPMKKGGMPMVMKDGKKVPAFAADSKGKMAKGGMAMKKPVKKMMGGGMGGNMGMGYAKGGGIEVKGKTKGKMIAMKKGGMGKAC